MSHPSWVCGLKLSDKVRAINWIESHPSWVCGLKLDALLYPVNGNEVTPFVGVWIETE